jgi:hypothetical protein
VRRALILLGLILGQAWGEGFETSRDLKRLQIGDQAGVVKVLGPDRLGEAYCRCLDEPTQARLPAEARQAVFQALGLRSGQERGVVHDIISNFRYMPKREAIAFLGVYLSASKLDSSTRERAERFLLEVLEKPSNSILRRQALLALAISNQLEANTCERVVAFFEKSDNLWETFPMVQFVDYHSSQLRAHPEYAWLRGRLERVPSLYTPQLLEFLPL